MNPAPPAPPPPAVRPAHATPPIAGFRSLAALHLLVVVALVWTALCARAGAQSAPAGNAHPHSPMVGQQLGPAFATTATGSDTSQEKHAFASQLNLDPLRGVAVFHAGRVKILDTLARETVRSITGRKNYFDTVPDEKGRGRKLPYDPLFTLIDLEVDPAYYAARPLIGVEYLPLRDEFLARAYAQASEAEWYRRLGRLSPEVIEPLLRDIAQKHVMEAPWRKACDAVFSSLSLFHASGSNLLLVAAEAPDAQWTHLSTLGPETPAGAAARALGEAWVRRDAPGVNAAALTLAAELPKINTAQYPGARRSLELAYNAAKPFEFGYWLYALSLLSLLLAFGTQRAWLRITGGAFLTLALAFHAFGFAARCVIAERLAIQNQFESMTGLSLGAVLAGAAILVVRRQWIFAAAAAAVGFLVLIGATQLAIPGVAIEREAAILNTSVLLKYHVTTVLVSYGLISLGFVVSLFYLGAHHFGSANAAAVGPGVSVALPAAALGINPSEGESNAPRVLRDLDTAQMTILQLAFWTLGVGILLGAWWADHSWGRWWAFDPKELWALVTWMVYLIVIHVRFVAKQRALVTAWLSVVGFFVMLWTYFGVNLILPGLHAYA